MNFSSHCSQIYCLALQFLPSLLMFTLNSHFIFTFTFWVSCWSGWINIKSFSFPSNQLIEFSRPEDVGCLEFLYQMIRFGYKMVHIDRMLFFNRIFVVIVVINMISIMQGMMVAKLSAPSAKRSWQCLAALRRGSSTTWKSFILIDSKKWRRNDWKKREKEVRLEKDRLRTLMITVLRS